jgi:hypothetical protein
MGYGLDGRISIPGRGKRFSLLLRMHTGPGVHLASNLKSIGAYFSGSKAAEA